MILRAKNGFGAKKVKFNEKCEMEENEAKTPKKHWFRKHSQHAAKKGPGIAKFLKFLENLKISQNSWNFVKFTKNPQNSGFLRFPVTLGSHFRVPSWAPFRG